MELAEAERPNHAKYKGQGSVGGGGTSMVAGFDLSDGGDGQTKVAWSGEAQVFGKLASIAGGLLEPLAKKNVQKLIDSLENALNRSA
jgi:carbon monoxide dehydrogenase subunit G